MREGHAWAECIIKGKETDLCKSKDKESDSANHEDQRNRRHVEIPDGIGILLEIYIPLCSGPLVSSGKECWGTGVGGSKDGPGGAAGT